MSCQTAPHRPPFVTAPRHGRHTPRAIRTQYHTLQPRCAQIFPAVLLASQHTFRRAASGVSRLRVQRRSSSGVVFGSLQSTSLPEDGSLDSTDDLNLTPHTITIPFGDREITLETGRIGRQANGAVMARDGDTMLLSTVCMGEESSTFSEFVPFSVTYQERFSAAGRTSGSFFKREGKPRDLEILVSRLVDRPIRPMFAKGFNAETQVLIWVLSYDCLHSPDALAITAAGAALAISDVPLSKPVSAVRVGLIDGEYIVNPTVQQMESSELDMVIAGTADAVLMIEGYCNFLPEEKLLLAVQKGQEAISVICSRIQEWADAIGKPKRRSGSHLPPSGLTEEVQRLVGADIAAAIRTKSKQGRGEALCELEVRLLKTLTSQGGVAGSRLQKAAEEMVRVAEVVGKEVAMDNVKVETADDDDSQDDLDSDEDLVVDRSEGGHSGKFFEVAAVKQAFKQICSHEMRRLVVQEGRRSDGRGPKEVRPISASCALLPRVHGSALFTRGETQAIAVTTLGGESMSQKLDNLTTKEGLLKRFYLQYTFPPCSVGETGRMTGVSRREIGHGTLAERALEPTLPEQSQFPYTVRVESTITESNGSSSMASVCGGCLSLQDAGVPIKTPVAGVAMGLILNTADCGGDGQPVILTDILGSEDALGDMDFKVAGSGDGVTAFQMDIKVEGITIDVMRQALEQAREGRRHILGEMAKCQPPPSLQVSPHAPRIFTIQIRRDKVRDIIGQQGKTIKSIIEFSGVDNIDINDDGTVVIYAKNEESLQKAQKRIEGLTSVPEVGKIYRNCVVKSIVMYGAFVELSPGQDALCHISELNTERVNKVEDVVREGDRIDVKLLEGNQRGQFRVSRKAVLLLDRELVGS